MRIIKKVGPAIAVLMFGLFFAFIQLLPTYKGIPVPFLQESKPSQPEMVQNLGNLNDSCIDIGRTFIGFPFRTNGYDYCQDGGVLLLPSIINLAVFIILAFIVYKSMKRILA